MELACQGHYTYSIVVIVAMLVSFVCNFVIA